jgi:ubiquinone/menaquinone biosynthesis C-methylase UbiE
MRPRHSGTALLLATTLALAWSPGCDACEATRDRRLQPDRVMDAVGLRAGMVVGEAGAGKGYFTVKLARRVGPEGRVYANDISKSSLDALEERCEEEGIANVTTILGEVEDPLFPDATLDIVFMVYALHDFDRPVAFLDNLEPDLKPGATLVVLDQDPAATGDDHFLERERLVEIFGGAGYELVRCEDFLERDLLCVFRVGR